MTDYPLPSQRRPDAEMRPRPSRWRVFMALVLREMGTRYGRNPGGYIWAVVEPLAMILVLSIGFSLLMRTPALGNYFLLFYATGFLPFQMFVKTANYVQQAQRYSRALLSYPVVTWFEVTVARAVTNGLTMCMTALCIFTGILLYLPGIETLDPGPIAAGFLAAFVLGVGVGLINAVLGGFFPVWTTLWGIATAPIFILSGVIWIYEDLPQIAKQYLYWNPLVHILGQTRSGFYPTYAPQYVDPIFVWALALGLLALGLLLMRRFHREILQNR